MNARAIAAGLTVAMLAGCASTGSGTTLLPGSSSNAVRPDRSDAASMKKHHRVKGYAHIVIRRPKKKHRGRGSDPRFISAATLGAEFVVKSDAGGSVTTDANLSPASPYCTTTGPNTSSCTVPVLMPFGNDTITITTYAQAPSNGGFDPSTELAVGSQTQTVTQGGSTPAINVYLLGIVDSIDAGPAFSSLPADGVASSEVFVVDGRDFGNKKIKAGSNDPYSNPITAKLTESGDSGNSHSTLQLNGGTAGPKAVLTQSTDSLQFNFDGAGKPGYTATVKFSAKGAPSQTIEISPLYVTATQIRLHTLNLNGSGVPARTMTITETDAPSGTTYAITRAACGSIANVSTASGTGSSATFTVQGGANPSAGGCVIAIADSNSPASPFALPATNTPLAGSVTIGGVTLTDYAVSSGTSTSITMGPDGNLWFIDPPSNIGVLNPNPGALPLLVADFTVPTASGSPPPSLLEGLAAGPDGAVWATDQTNGGADRVVPITFGVSNYPLAGNTPTGIVSSSDGTLWTGSSSQTSIVNLTVGGGFSLAPSPGPGAAPNRLAQSPDGAIWFTEGQDVGRMDTVNHTIDEIPAPSSTTPFDLCVRPDGSVWFTSNGTSSFVSEITGTPGNYTIANSFPAAGGATLTGIACGVDNAIWYLDASVANNDVGRISLNTGNAQTTYAIPDASFGARFITLGPDGTLWYTSANTNMMGQILP